MLAVVPPRPLDTPVESEADGPIGMVNPAKTPVFFLVPKSLKIVAKADALNGNERVKLAVKMSERTPEQSSK